MKNRKHILYAILLISIPLLVGIIAISISYGWYVKVIRTGKIDGSTKNVSINYELKNGEDAATNTLTYSIDNLAFFDIENSDETPFFNSMAVDLKLKLTNTAKSDMKYTITYQATKRIIKDEEENDVSISYVACFYNSIPNNYNANTKISSLATNSNTCSYTNNSTLFSATYESQDFELKAANQTDSDEVTLDLYLIGVQEIPTAKNTDFMYTESLGVKSLIQYQFTITITGIPKSDSSAAENENETTDIIVKP